MAYPENMTEGRANWHRAWCEMWRSIGYACERSVWDKLGHWSRPMGSR